MGHIINPINLRIGYNIYWNTVWNINNKYLYNKVLKHNWFFFQFLNWFFYKKVHIKINLIFSHYKIFINNLGKIFINLYYYWPSIDKNKKLHLRKLYYFIKLRWNNKVNRKIQIKDSLQKRYQLILTTAIANLYWYLVSKYWKFYLKFFHLNKFEYSFRFFNLSFFDVTSSVVTKYITARLKRKYSLMYVLRPVLRDLHLRLRQKRIAGYKLICSGRFTRKQIATKSWFKNGYISSNNISNKLDYSEDTVKLKYGICGIKLWISYGPNARKSYNKKPELISFINKKIQVKNFYLSFSSNQFSLFNLNLNLLYTLSKKWYEKNLTIKMYLYMSKFLKKNLINEINYINLNKKLQIYIFTFLMNYIYKNISINQLQTFKLINYLDIKKSNHYKIYIYK